MEKNEEYTDLEKGDIKIKIPIQEEDCIETNVFDKDKANIFFPKETKVNKEGLEIKLSKENDIKINKDKTMDKNFKNIDEDSIDISISSISLNEEELLNELLKDEKKAEKENKSKISKQLNNKMVEKYINEKKLLNHKRESTNSNNENIMNKNNNISNNPEPILSEDEKNINELINKYSFDVIFKTSIKNNLDSQNNLDKIIINLIEKLGYKQFFKLLFTRYGLFNSINIDEFQSKTRDEESKYKSLKSNEKIIIKSMDIKSNKYRQIQKNNITKNNKGLGLHLHKNKSGDIYKYLLHRVDSNKGWFYCSDRNCKGIGILNLKTKQFIVTREHTLRYQEHSFYARILPNEVCLFKYFTHYSKNDAQIIYKYNGEVYAVFY